VSRTQRLLAAAFVVQAALALLTWSWASRGTGAAAGRLLVEFDPAGVSALDVVGEAGATGDERRTVKLAREGETWSVASAAGYPAKAEKVDEVLRLLSGIRVETPIAITAANHAALHVGDREFGRKVTVQTKDGAVDLVLGSGPRSTVHVRRADRPEVYAVRGLNLWSIPDEPRGYIETEFVEVSDEDLERVTVRNAHGELNLAKTPEGWALAELPPRSELEEGAARSFLTAAGRLTLQRPVGRESKPEFGFEQGAIVTLLKTAKEGAEPETIEYTIGNAADERSYYARASSGEWVVTVPKWNAEQVRDKKPSDFVRKEKSAPHAGAP
jgi:hypothetical protein